MKRKNRIIWLLMFAGVCLAASSLLLEADDTYNFYWQKAPGPAVVNQGVSGQTAPAQISSQPVAAGNAEAPVLPAAATNVAHSAPPEVTSDYHRWEFSLGGTLPYRSNQAVESSGLPMSRRPLSGLYTAGLQLNVTDILGLRGEYLFNKKARKSWSAGLALTPFRIRIDSVIKIALGAEAGVQAVPVQVSESNFYNNYSDYPIVTEIMPYYGARAALELSQKIAFQGAFRRLNKLKTNQVEVGMAYYF